MTALQILPAVTRAFLISPFLSKGLVKTVGLTTPSANIPILDFLYGTNGGVDGAATRLDNQEDPTYSDASDCMADPREIDASITRETVTVSIKKLGNDICVPAIDWANSQWNIDLKGMLRDMIQQVMVREWARNISDAIRTMAGVTASWSLTIPGPYSSLNTNEWRQVLAETIVTMNATARARIFEGFEWGVWTPAVAAILQRSQRAITNLTFNGNVTDPSTLGYASGQFGDVAPGLEMHEDPFLSANTIVLGRKTLQLTPTPVDPFMFLAYQMMADVSFLLYPKAQRIEMGGLTQAALKMLVPNAFGTLSIVA